MKLSGRVPAAVAAALVAGVLLGGCLEKKDYDEVRYYRAVRREPSGATRGVGEITRKQATTQEHWRFYLTRGCAERMALHDNTGALVSEVRADFDPKGRVVEERTYTPDERKQSTLTIESRLTLTYDERDRVIGFQQFSADAGLNEERQWEYDERGRLKEARVYGHHGRLRWRDKFVYDRDDPATLRLVRRYDGKHRLVSQIPPKDYNFWE